MSNSDMSRVSRFSEMYAVLPASTPTFSGKNVVLFAKFLFIKLVHTQKCRLITRKDLIEGKVIIFLGKTV